MTIQTIADFTASDLKQSGPILDTATRGLVRIRRRGDAFLLMREVQFERLVAEAADPRPKTLADLLIGYDPKDVKERLSGWLADAPEGHEGI